MRGAILLRTITAGMIPAAIFFSQGDLPPSSSLQVRGGTIHCNMSDFQGALNRFLTEYPVRAGLFSFERNPLIASAGVFC